MNVAVEPAIECAELGANQDEGPGDPGSLQEPMQIIHHPGRQQYSSVSAQKPGHSATGPRGLFIQIGGIIDEYNRLS